MGVDEVGRGPLAGNVVAAAVVLPVVLPTSLTKLTDSKKLTENQRLSLVRPIIKHAVAYGVARVGPSTIDEINILQATLRAMHVAVTKAAQRLSGVPDIVLVDGNRPIPNLNLPQMTLVKGDARSFAIAAASILAKVVRDREMVLADRQFPAYGFARHKGYGTVAHRQALSQFGLSPLHRRSFKWRSVPERGRNG
ncbi:MAG: ribonuclease HII [Bradymonadia bacterium]